MSNISNSADGYNIGYHGQSLVVVLPGDLFLELVHCSAGTFTMGSPTSELGRENDEICHQVTLSHDFYLGKYPVTRQEYNVVMGKKHARSNFFEALCHGDPGDFLPSAYGRKWPANMVSWEDACQFCQTLNSLLGDKLPKGYKFSLPTEAQWEYACRAGTESAYNNGLYENPEGVRDLNLSQLAWYFEDIPYSFFYRNERHLIPRGVGRKLPNAWGLYDMHGNVFEWCSDWYGSYDEGDYNGKGSYNAEIIDPLGPTNPTGQEAARVCRGGSFFNVAIRCRSAKRDSWPVNERNELIGFRLAATFVQE